MNERIKELAEQAETKEIGYYFFDKEKFAELVIADCIAMCKTAVGTPDYNRGRMDCLDNIKEHFGIKK